MSRVKRGVTSRAKHKRVLKSVKGQWGRRKNTIRVAKQAMEKAMQYAYRDRRNKKRDFKTTMFSTYGNKIFFVIILLYIFLTFSFNRMKNE